MKKIVLFLIVFTMVFMPVFAQAAPETVQEGVLVLNDNVPSGDLEIFSWWAGDEGPALEALIADFNMKYPKVNLINATVTGGSGVNAKAVLKTRMIGGDPPEAFQVHAGQELIGTWVESGRMYDLTPLFEKNGWYDVFPEDLIGLIGTEDGIWSVPVCVHKSNVMWYIPENLKKWNVKVPTTIDEFLDACEKLKMMGITPLSVGQTWTQNENWENIALAVLGYEDYNRLWSGDLMFNDPKVVHVWEVFGKILGYTNSDAASLSWQQASDMVINGEAAFNWMGDWAAGYFTTTKKLVPGTDFGWGNVPGTNGVFQFLSDSFGIPIGCKNVDAAVAWLEECGSKSGQDAFNPLKGSIPARIDMNTSLYSEYSLSAAADFANDVIVGSLAHGCVANEGFMGSFSKVMEKFLNDMNAEEAAEGCYQAAMENGIYN